VAFDAAEHRGAALRRQRTGDRELDVEPSARCIAGRGDVALELAEEGEHVAARRRRRVCRFELSDLALGRVLDEREHLVEGVEERERQVRIGDRDVSAVAARIHRSTTCRPSTRNHEVMASPVGAASTRARGGAARVCVLLVSARSRRAARSPSSVNARARRWRATASGSFHGRRLRGTGS